MAEDMAFTLQLIRNCNTISYVSDTCYNYFYNTNSITKQNSEDKIKANYLAISHNVRIIKTAYEAEKDLKTGIGYIEMLSKTSLYPCIKYAGVCRMFSPSFSDLKYLFFHDVKMNVKLSYLYCLFVKSYNRLFLYKS